MTIVDDATSLAAFNSNSAGQPIVAPANVKGALSVVGAVNFVINGQALDVNVSKALVTAELLMAMTQASTLTLTLHDPDRIILSSGLFSQKSVVSFGAPSLAFSLVSVEKQDNVLTVTFESYVVAALRTATGPFTVAAGQMTRTEFAQMLVSQVPGSGFVAPPPSWLYAQNAGYDRPSQEQLSRGTSTAPGEDSWTCLQRLANEIQWVCFEAFGNVYFGPEKYLGSQQTVMTIQEGVGGVNRINGTYDIAQAELQLSITAEAASWLAIPGETIGVLGCGPFDTVPGSPLSQAWIVSQIERDDMSEPDITITCVQPQAGLPEPATGGAAAAVGPNYANGGSQQTAGGSQAAQLALAYDRAQLGKQYSSTIDGGVGPSAFDCSGLQQAAYASAGIPIPRTTTTQWAAGLYQVPGGIANLEPGDLMYFEGGDPPPPGHVAMVESIDTGTNTVNVINAYDQALGIRRDSFPYVNPGGNTDFAGTYYGALRPAP